MQEVSTYETYEDPLAGVKFTYKIVDGHAELIKWLTPNKALHIPAFVLEDIPIAKLCKCFCTEFSDVEKIIVPNSVQVLDECALFSKACAWERDDMVHYIGKKPALCCRTYLPENITIKNQNAMFRFITLLAEQRRRRSGEKVLPLRWDISTHIVCTPEKTHTSRWLQSNGWKVVYNTHSCDVLIIDDEYFKDIDESFFEENYGLYHSAEFVAFGNRSGLEQEAKSAKTDEFICRLRQIV